MTAPAAPLNLWDIRPDETARAYAAFAVYRDMGPGRSLERVSQTVPLRLPTAKDWSSKFAWAERVRAFDAAAAKLAADRSLEDHASVRARHAEWGRTLAIQGMRRLSKVTGPNGETLATFDPREFAPGEARQAVKDGVAIEAEALLLDRRAVSHEVSGPGGGPVEGAVKV